MDPTRIDRFRAETPAVRQGLVHLNNAGASLMPDPVLDAVRSHLDREVALGGYEAAAAAAAEIEAAYADVARLLGAAPRNVAFVENATVAFSQALSALDPGPGDVILTSRNDYVSNQLAYLSLARRRGVEVVRADDLPEGGVDPQSVRERIGERRPTLVALTWVPTNSGLVQDAEAVGVACEEAGVPYLLDACQAVGQIPIDVDRLRCDFLSATSRKFLRGPRGSGFLFVSDRTLDAGMHPLLPDLRGATWTGEDRLELAPDARRFENWEFAWALVLGTGAAARYALDVDVEEGGRRAAELAARFRAAVADSDSVRVLDRGAALCAIATVAVAGRDAGDLVTELREWGINTSSADRTAAVLDMDDKGASSIVRVSPHYYNTEREVDTAASALLSLVEAQ